MDTINTIQLIAILALPVLFAITVHEAAHGWAAGHLGDGTARLLGRVTLNPLKHIDPIGTIAVPLATFLLTGFLFGWAKPVPIDTRNLRNPRRDMALVALAGPGANLLMAVIWGLVIQIGLALWNTSQWLAQPLESARSTQAHTSRARCPSGNSDARSHARSSSCTRLGSSTRATPASGTSVRPGASPNPGSSSNSLAWIWSVIARCRRLPLRWGHFTPSHMSEQAGRFFHSLSAQETGWHPSGEESESLRSA